MFMKKRGQAAMEFLMTYGWAILVVLVVIGALAYFGVLNPQSFLPKKCQFTTGLVCEDHKLDDATGLTIRLNNGLGNDIQVRGLTFDADNNAVDCQLATQNENTTLTAGKSANVVLNQTAAGCMTAMVPFAGTRVKGTLAITYLDLQTQFDHTVTGTLLTDVE